jgi:serine/threonine-protein kinase
MADDSRVQNLLDELLNSHATPEEVCESYPDLLPVVRNRWRQMRRLRADLDVLFPPSDDLTPFAADGFALPSIPGYEVEDVLGRGGMGVVFRARHVRLDRPVAIKMMLAGPYAEPREKERFQREAQAIAGLHHPNVVPIYDVGDVDGRPYYTMELIEGGSLAHKLAGTPQPGRPAAELLATLARAVQAAHQAGIVHRDLKPANVLLAADGTPKVSDFGLARRLEGDAGLTQTGVPVGTPSYMAPEQARGQTNAVGTAVDVYALGAILYELLTGRPPFRAATATETMQQVISQEPAPPSRLNDQVPRDLDTICLKCLSKEPGRRYANAAALADDLERFVEGRPIRARPVGWVERTWRWGWRNPAAAALLATALVLVGLASGGGVWFVQRRAEHERDLRRDIDMAVAQAARLRDGYQFHEAFDLLEQARQRLATSGPDDLHWQVKQAADDLDLAKRLDAARLQAAAFLQGKYNPAAVEPWYVSAFADAGLGRVNDDIDAVAARVRESAVRNEIVAALDDWASITRDRQRREWLLAVACKADTASLRDGLRQPDLWQNEVLWKSPDRSTKLIEELKRVEPSPQLVIALGRAARGSGGDPVPLLATAQARFPHDFWLKSELGTALYEADRPEEALGYFRTALGLRPTASAAHGAVGTALSDLGRKDESLPFFDEALRLDPTNIVARNNRASALSSGRIDEAIGDFQQVLGIDPKFTLARYNLAAALYSKGRVNEAIEQFEQVLSAEPESAAAHYGLGVALHTKGRVDEAIDHYQQSIKLDPKFALVHSNLGVALRAKGRLDEAIDQFQQAVRLDPKLVGAQTALGHTLYDAARGAIRALARQGAGEGQIGEPERADKRRRALGWLRANLEMTTRMLNEGKAVDWSLSTWHTDPALASVRDQAALAKLPDAEREQWQRLWADVAAHVAADPLEQGRARAGRRDWAGAAEGYAWALKRGPTDDGHFWFEYAAVLLLSGDRAGYARACAHMVDSCAKPGGSRPYHMARACMLAPDAVADSTLPGKLAEEELQSSAKEFWSLTEQGAIAYRAGRFRDSELLFQRSLKADSKPGRALVNWFWLALANQRLGNVEEAHRWLSKAQAWLDKYADGVPDHADEKYGLHLHNWLEAHVLRREAEALIGPTGP